MYLLKKTNTEDSSIAWILAPGVKKDDISITSTEKSISVDIKGNEFWDSDSATFKTNFPIKEVLAHVSGGILSIEIKYDIPKKKAVKVTID